MSINSNKIRDDFFAFARVKFYILYQALKYSQGQVWNEYLDGIWSSVNVNSVFFHIFVLHDQLIIYEVFKDSWFLASFHWRNRHSGIGKVQRQVATSKLARFLFGFDNNLLDRLSGRAHGRLMGFIIFEICVQHLGLMSSYCRLYPNLTMFNIIL